MIDLSATIDANGGLTVDDLARWLDEREDELVEAFDEAVDVVLGPRVDAYLDSLTASGDPAVFDGVSAAFRVIAETELAEQLTMTWLGAAIASYQTSPVVDLIDELVFVEVVNERAIEYQAAAANRIVGATNDVWEEVRDRVVANLAVGVDIDDLRREISDSVGYAKVRAEAIARTETIGAYNGGDWAAVDAMPPELRPDRKRWVATRDARTRPSHAEAGGQTVPLAEPFSVGGVEMMRPHAPGAPASEVVNCRCVTAMLWPGDD